MIDSTIKAMIAHARQALSFAYAPYSKYPVASCICSEDNSLYTGVNVENTSYGLTICAESSAICQLISAGKQRIKSLIILNAQEGLCFPCGACRQRIVEFSSDTTLIHLCSFKTVLKSFTIHELLPYAFSFTPDLE